MREPENVADDRAIDAGGRVGGAETADGAYPGGEDTEALAGEREAVDRRI